MNISASGKGQSSNYRGRFAPSPTGPLHAGSLIAALASFLDARANQGEWYVRMEDLDPPRESPEAAKQILQALENLGLHWDDRVLYQSQRQPAYHEALLQLQHEQMIFPCTCSRQDMRKHAGVYQGICRNRLLESIDSKNENYALRCRVPDITSEFHDLVQEQQAQNLQSDVGDFIIKRKDGLYAYQLAVVVDDAFQEITHVIRGIDLIDSTHRQMHLQSLLQYPQPVYGHIPVIINSQGQKLSKQHHAKALDLQNPVATLCLGLRYLQQSPPAELLSATTQEVLNWGIANWNILKLNNIQQIPEHRH